MWEKVKFIMSQLWEFLKPFIKILMSEFGQALADAAMKAVLFASSQDMSNSDKRDTAFKMIMEDLKTKGISVSSSVIYTAIEVAVQKLKAETSK